MRFLLHVSELIIETKYILFTWNNSQKWGLVGGPGLDHLFSEKKSTR